MSEFFYREVVQTVLLFGSNYWVLPEAMIRAMEGYHLGILRQINVKLTKRQAKRTWETPEAEEFRRAAGTKSVAEYIGKR